MMRVGSRLNSPNTIHRFPLGQLVTPKEFSFEWSHLKVLNEIEGVTTQMKALNEYFLMVVFTFMFKKILCLIWTEKHTCTCSSERFNQSTSLFVYVKDLISLIDLHSLT